MHGGFVGDLATVLVVAAITLLVSVRLRQSTVLGYLAAGLIVGPYLPIPVFADPHRIEALSEFGVVLVMFSVGLELRLARLAKVLPTSGLTGLVQIGALLWAGSTLGQLLGWSPVGAAFLGGAIAISSTMIVTRAFAQHPVSGDVREHVLGVLVLQDVAAVALIAVLTAVAAGAELSLGAAGVVLLRLGLILAAMVVGGLLVLPRLMRAVVDAGNPEVLVVVTGAACFGFALLAGELGYSGALGAFVAGVLVAESGRGHDVEHVVAPLRDLFAAVFFVAVGMTVDPRLVLANLPVALLVTATVIGVQLVSVTVAGLLSGLGVSASVMAGLALGQIGEFAFVIVAIATAADVAPPALQPVVVAVAVLTAFTSPIAIGASPRIAAWIEARVPARLETLLALYGGWRDRLNDARQHRLARVPTTLVTLAFEGGALVLVAVAARLFQAPLTTWLAEHGVARASLWVSVGFVVVALGPFGVLVRSARALAGQLAASMVEEAVPGQLSADARRVVSAGAQLVVLVGLGVPIIGLVRPFLPGPLLFVPLLAYGALLVWRVWRDSGKVDLEVRSQARAFLSRLVAEPQPEADDALLPGVQAVEVLIRPDDPAVGRSLTDLDLRARTGATAVGIRRGEHTEPVDGTAPLQAGDRLVLVGGGDATTRARALLHGGGHHSG